MSSYPITPPRKTRENPNPGLETVPTGPDTPRSTPVRADGDANNTDLRPKIARLLNAETVVCMIEDFIGYYFPDQDEETVNKVLDLLKQDYPDLLMPRPHFEDDKEEETTAEEDDGYLSDEEEDSKQPTVYSHVLSDFDEPPSVKKKKGKANVNEVKLFDPMAALGEAIRDVLAKITGVQLNNYHIRMCPHSNLESDLDGCNQRIDAAATENMGNEGGKLRITDIVVPFEFKVRRTRASVIENREQVASHTNHTMNDDPRRKFMFAITIEDDRVSIWFFSRSHSVKARSFSIVERPDLYIRILVSLFCATDEQLGFDPLVTLVEGKRYVYELPATGKNQGESTYYLTVQSLEEYHSLRLRGKSTRIWKVIQVKSHEDLKPVDAKPKHMVLKDISMDINTPTEADIQHDLFRDLDELQKNDAWRQCEILKDYTEDDRNTLADAFEGGYRRFFSCIKAQHVGEPGHFVCPQAWTIPEVFPLGKGAKPGVDPLRTTRTHLATEQSGDVVQGTATEDQGKENGTLEGTEVSDNEEVASSIDGEADDAEKDTGATDEFVQRGPSIDMLNPRRQCRFLYDTVCTSLQDIHTLGEAVDIIQQALIALRIMSCAGWVHRDISAGNILAYKETQTSKWQVKLSDLEYAKKFPSDRMASAIPKTGTPKFMACEILLEGPLLGRMKRTRGRVQALSDSLQRRQVAHNYQHDLESIWWILLWLVSHRVNRMGLPRTFGNHYFKDSVELGYAQSRSALFRDVDTALGNEPMLVPCLPSALRRSVFIQHLDTLRSDLVTEYYTRHEDGNEANIRSYSWVSGECFSSFFEAIKGSRRVWHFIPLVTEREIRQQAAGGTLPLSKKRKAATDTKNQVGGGKDSEKATGNSQTEDERRPCKKVRS